MCQLRCAALLLVALGTLSGCALADTDTAGAAGASAQAEEAAQARRTEQAVRDQVAAAERAAEQQRRDAEAQNP